MPPSPPDDSVKLFLSYAREDFDAVSALYDRLEALGLRPWMDKRDLLPGQRWRDVIAREVKQCELVLVCLSPQSVDKRGFYQREIRAALDAWQEKRQDDIYLIPVRLAECDVPQELEEFNWVDLYDTDGWTLLLRAIAAAAGSLGRQVPIALAEAVASKKKQPPQNPAEALADQVTIGRAGARKRLQTEYGELQRQYDTLTRRIAAVDIDLGRALDGEQRLVLEERRAELAGRRGEVNLRMDQIEKEWAVPVESSPTQPAKPVEPARPDLLIVDKPLRLELVRVPAGEFLMGSDPEKDLGAFDFDKPQHRLSLPEYYIGKYPVTNEQYAVFVEQTKGAAPEHWRGGKIPSGKEKHPVVNVTWHDARAFCAWVSQASGGEIRLPSEAEWEKAARGVDGRLYPWGNQAPSAELCNFNQNVGNTTPVERYPQGASPFGALDMAGNVWEWTSSLFNPDPYNAADGREDLQAPVDISRVVRGGSFILDGGDVRCAYRDFDYPDDRGDLIGFRVVCVSPPHHGSGL